MSPSRKALLIVAAVVVLAVLLPAGSVSAASPKNKKDDDSYTIGGVLSGYESEKHFRETIEVSELNFGMNLLAKPFSRWPRDAAGSLSNIQTDRCAHNAACKY